MSDDGWSRADRTVEHVEVADDGTITERAWRNFGKTAYIPELGGGTVYLLTTKTYPPTEEEAVD